MVYYFGYLITSSLVTKFCTHEVFHLHYELHVLLLMRGSVLLLHPVDSNLDPQGLLSELSCVY